MDQFIYASLSHTHYYWYEVGMLKVPAMSPYCYMVQWHYYRNLLLTFLIIILFLFCFVWHPCIQYSNGGLLPDIILLLTLHYYHRGTRLNGMKRDFVFFVAYDFT